MSDHSTYWFGFVSGMIFSGAIFLSVGTAINRINERELLDRVARGKTVTTQQGYAQYSAVRRLAN